MAHAHVNAVALRRLAQRQLARRRRESAVAHDHRPVVQRAALAENRPQQRRRHFCVDWLARLDERFQHGLALNDDQRADTFAGHRFRGVGELVRDGMLAIVGRRSRMMP